MEGYQSIKLHILIVNPNRTRLKNLDKLKDENTQIHLMEDLANDTDIGQLTRIIISKYSYLAPEVLPNHISNLDYLRWSLKPSLILHLLKTEGIDHILYCDCDIHFYGDFDFILEKFEDHDILLSPHWREIRPQFDNDFKWNFLHGLYNAGFIGISKNAKDMLMWWAEMCAIECSADKNDRGTYVDQKYLDAVPLYFPNTHIIRHYGCNVAAWNMRHLPRQITESGDITIAGDPLIFIHYSNVTIDHIVKGIDFKLYEPYFKYQEALKRKQLELIRKGLSECISKEMENKQII